MPPTVGLIQNIIFSLGIIPTRSWLLLYFSLSILSIDPTIINITLEGNEPLPADKLNARNCLNITRDCSNVKTSPFRTFDGSCNNLVAGRENFGSIERAFKRRLPVAFGDGKCDVTGGLWQHRARLQATTAGGCRRSYV